MIDLIRTRIAKKPEVKLEEQQTDLTPTMTQESNATLPATQHPISSLRSSTETSS